MSELDKIADLFTIYGECFDDADAERMLGLFAYPVTIWQFGKGHVFLDEDELRENAEALIDAFDEAGVVVSSPDVVKIELSGNAAFAHVNWEQGDNEEEVIHAFTCRYFLLQTGDEWRIASIINEDLE